MAWQWILLGLFYLALFLSWLDGRRPYKGFDRYAQRIMWVLERVPASEQDRLAAMVRSGQIIDAIKDLRASAGTDLATAKATVEGLAIFRPPAQV